VTDLLAPTSDGIARASALLSSGAIVAFPTDTVYGVGVAAARPERVTALFALKVRPVEKQIPMLVADLSQATGAGWEADERAHGLARRFWPGPLTIVLPFSPELPPPREGATQAFRAPDHPVALALIERAGPLLTTSANRSGEPETLSADDVLIAFATQADGLDAVVDGGRVPGGVASTVLDLSVTPARILREGPIDPEALGDVVRLVDAP
jgi:L-threonylcarbamoyladenylate synthase